MAYLKDRAYDIFISYAHDDDVDTNWVTYFRRYVATELNKKIKLKDKDHYSEVKIWKDEHLPQHGDLNDRLAEVLHQSSILLVFMSPYYLASEVGADEVRRFIKEFENDSLPRIFIVNLEKTSSDDWPAELRAETGHRLMSYDFYQTRDNDKTAAIKLKDDAGFLLSEAQIRIRDLAADMFQLLYQIRHHELSLRPAGKTRLYLAVGHETLSDQRARLGRHLMNEGFALIPKRIPRTPSRIRQECRESLPHCAAYVQLVNKFDGMAGTGTEHGFVADQMDEAVKAKSRSFFWDDPNSSIRESENASYQKLFDDAAGHVSSGDFEEFAREIKAALDSDDSSDETGPTASNTWWLEVRYLPEDSEYAEFLESAIEEASEKLSSASYVTLRHSPDDSAHDRDEIQRETEGVVIVWGKAGLGWAKREINIGLGAMQSYGKPPAVALFNPCPKPHIGSPNLLFMDLHDEARNKAVQAIGDFLEELNRRLEAKAVHP